MVHLLRVPQQQDSLHVNDANDILNSNRAVVVTGAPFTSSQNYGRCLSNESPVITQRHPFIRYLFNITYEDSAFGHLIAWPFSQRCHRPLQAYYKVFSPSWIPDFCGMAQRLLRKRETHISGNIGQQKHYKIWWTLQLESRVYKRS